MRTDCFTTPINCRLLLYSVNVRHLQKISHCRSCSKTLYININRFEFDDQIFNIFLFVTKFDNFSLASRVLDVVQSPTLKNSCRVFSWYQVAQNNDHLLTIADHKLKKHVHCTTSA
uniref:SJCHGC06348 protein n=1 Tax=Schistosoma japonicum TaxID=6182 RepID=Q5DHG3_SCHJA|nr:SJCHGC06348 protein [Schistosoma japonicum]